MDNKTVFRLFDDIDAEMVEAEMFLDCMSITLESLSCTARIIPYLRPYENAFTVIMAGLKRCVSRSNEITKHGFEEYQKSKESASQAPQ